MKTYKNYYVNENNHENLSKKDVQVLKDDEGYVHVAMTTSIFDDVGKNLLATNSMFACLLGDIRPCVEPYSTKEMIALDIFETQDIDEFTIHSVEYSFKNYVNSCYNGLKKQHMSRFALFCSFLIVGVLIEVVLYGFLNGKDLIPFWLFKSIEVLGNLFIWQFGGYLAFEFLGEHKKLRRYKQIANAKFNIKKWD